MTPGFLRPRLKAGGIHLGISMLIALIAMGLIFGVWYPAPLGPAQGVNHLVLIMIGVDVVIGPLITTVVYDPQKKWLRLDLAVIAALQTCALLYGLQAIYGGRPAYVVFNVDRFDVVAVQDVDAPSAAKADAAFRPSPWGPKTLGARAPMDREARNKLLFSSVMGGADLPQLPEYFVPLQDMRGDMIRRLHPLDELRKLNAFDDAAWKAFVDSFGKPESELGYLPMAANARDGAVILDAKTGEIRGIRLLAPAFGPISPPSGHAASPEPVG